MVKLLIFKILKLYILYAGHSYLTTYYISLTREIFSGHLATGAFEPGFFGLSVLVSPAPFFNCRGCVAPSPINLRLCLFYTLRVIDV